MEYLKTRRPFEDRHSRRAAQTDGHRQDAVCRNSTSRWPPPFFPLTGGRGAVEVDG
jgi:hypothetical protein